MDRKLLFEDINEICKDAINCANEQHGEKVWDGWSTGER